MYYILSQKNSSVDYTQVLIYDQNHSQLPNNLMNACDTCTVVVKILAPKKNNWGNYSVCPGSHMANERILIKKEKKKETGYEQNFSSLRANLELNIRQL